MCIVCEGKNIEGLEELDCSECLNVTSIPNIVGLKQLWCSGCSNLTTIPVINGLKVLNCSFCPNITTIPVIAGLKVLNCSFCLNIKTIPNINGLEELFCYGCLNVTTIPNISKLKYLKPSDCPWLPQNPDNKITLGLKLQSWIRKNYRYFVFKRWIKSQEGREFLYDPKRIGGRIEISKMKKALEYL